MAERAAGHNASKISGSSSMTSSKSCRDSMTRWSRKRSCASEIRGSMPERAGSAIACEPGPEIGPESVLVRGPVCAAVTGWPTNKVAPSIERRRRLDETFTVPCRLQFVRDQVRIEICRWLVPRQPEKVIGSLVACVAGRNLCSADGQPMRRHRLQRRR